MSPIRRLVLAERINLHHPSSPGRRGFADLVRRQTFPALSALLLLAFLSHLFLPRFDPDHPQAFATGSDVSTSLGESVAGALPFARRKLLAQESTGTAVLQVEAAGAQTQVRAQSESQELEGAPGLKTEQALQGADTGSTPSAPAETDTASEEQAGTTKQAKKPASEASAAGSFLEQLRTCSGNSSKALKFRFRNVVLILSTEDSRVQAADLWRQVYSRVFGHVVVVSENAFPDLNIQAASDWYPDPPSPLQGSSMFRYLALPTIMQQHPKAAGFLWASDDVIINYWNLVNTSKNKLWLAHKVDGVLTPTKHGLVVDQPGPSNQKMQYAYEATPAQVIEMDRSPEQGLAVPSGESWADLPAFKVQIQTLLENLNPRYTKQYHASCRPKKNVYLRTFSKLFYIPARYSADISSGLIAALKKAQVVADLAIPFMFYSLEHPRHFSQDLDGIIALPLQTPPELGAAEALHSLWSNDSPAFHPWRVESKADMDAVLRTLGQSDGCLKDLYTD